MQDIGLLLHDHIATTLTLPALCVQVISTHRGDGHGQSLERTSARSRISIRWAMADSRYPHQAPPVPPKDSIDANALTSQFEQLLKTRRLNDLVERSQRPIDSAPPSRHTSSSSRPPSRQAPRPPVENPSTPPAYSSLRNHPKIATPPQDSSSTRFIVSCGRYPTDLLAMRTRACSTKHSRWFRLIGFMVRRKMRVNFSKPKPQVSVEKPNQNGDTRTAW